MAAPLALALIVKLVLLLMLVMDVSAGMFVPAKTSSMTNPAVLVTVTELLPLVIVTPGRVVVQGTPDETRGAVVIDDEIVADIRGTVVEVDGRID